MRMAAMTRKIFIKEVVSDQFSVVSGP